MSLLTDCIVPMPAGPEDEEPADEEEDGLTLLVPSGTAVKSRMSSTSSAASYDSQGTNGEGTETPTVQSEDEDGQSDDLLITPTSDDEKAPSLLSPWEVWMDEVGDKPCWGLVKDYTCIPEVGRMF